MVVDRVGRADLLELSIVEDGDAIRELQRLVLVMRHEDGRVAGAAMKLAQPGAQVLAHLGVERAEGLVEQQHPRLDGERARQRHALPLAARELRRKAAFEAGELHELQKLPDTPLDLRRRRPFATWPRPEPEGDIVRDGEMAEQSVALEHHADPSLPERERIAVDTVEGDAPAIQRIEPGDQPQQRRLARA